MNDKQSEELIKHVSRIADALERISPPSNDRKEKLNKIVEELSRTPKGTVE